MEEYIHVAAGVGHHASTHRSQLGVLAAADRDADVHPHSVQSEPKRRRRAVSAALLRHVPVADPGAVRGRHAEPTAGDHADRVQEGVELSVHVGRRGRAGRARLPAQHHGDHSAVRGRRGPGVHDQRRFQHQPHGPVAQLRRAVDGHHQHGRVVWRHHRSAAGRIHDRRPGKADTRAL